MNYTPYKNLPPLVGLTDFDTASEPGLSVEQCVKRLKRIHYTLWRIHEICMAHIASEPIYELKMAFSHHGFLAAENDTAFRTRVGEMREPPLGLEKVPHPGLDVFFDEILGTPTTEERILGLYEIAIPALREALHRYIAETHPLADSPSARLCRLALVDVEAISAWGERAIECLVTEAHREEAGQWLSLLGIALANAGGLDGSDGERADTGALVRHYSSDAFQFDPVPQRDERFQDPFNLGVNPEAYLYDETKPAETKIPMLFFKRLREIDVPELMSGIITQTKGKPWGYYRDMTRQLWDEARHAMMGEVGFVAAGIDWPKLVMVNHTWSYILNTQQDPKARHAVLFFIEQGLMPKTGKRHEWIVSQEAGSPLAVTFQDFDWADEVLHARIGRDWYVADMPSSKEAIEFGDKSWSTIMSGYDQFRREGRTQHRNWWPDLYRAWCASNGTEPDPECLAFDTSYEGKRADLKEVAIVLSSGAGACVALTLIGSDSDRPGTCLEKM